MALLKHELNDLLTKQGGYQPHVMLQINDSEENRINKSIPEVGSMAINFELPDDRGEKVTLDTLLKEGPIILNFFRGNFCDFCQLQLKALQRSIKEFKRYNATLVGISPSLITIQTVLKDSLELTYSILSDEGSKVAEAYGLKYSLSDELVSIFEGFGIDYEANYGESAANEPSLPIPATFVINTDKTVVFAFHDSDYTKRAEPADIIASLISIS